MENFRRTKIYKICGYIGCLSLLCVFLPLIISVFSGGWAFIFAPLMLLGIIAWYPISLVILIIAFFIMKVKSVNSKYSPVADIGNYINVIISVIGIFVLLMKQIK